MGHHGKRPTRRQGEAGGVGREPWLPKAGKAQKMTKWFIVFSSPHLVFIWLRWSGEFSQKVAWLAGTMRGRTIRRKNATADRDPPGLARRQLVVTRKVGYQSAVGPSSPYLSFIGSHPWNGRRKALGTQSPFNIPVSLFSLLEGFLLLLLSTSYRQIFRIRIKKT
jgi:hypothetical protein